MKTGRLVVFALGLATMAWGLTEEWSWVTVALLLVAAFMPEI